MISIKVFAPAFILARGGPAILPERSSTRAISTGFDIISGAAVRASVTFSVSPHAICPVLSTLFEFVIPIRITSFWGGASKQSMRRSGSLLWPGLRRGSTLPLPIKCSGIGYNR